MRFSKTDNIYKIIRITGSQDNILGISFGEDDVEVIEWNFNNSDSEPQKGLESVNKSLGTNYKLSKIYFSPFDISTNRIYSGLIAAVLDFWDGFWERSLSQNH